MVKYFARLTRLAGEYRLLTPDGHSEAFTAANDVAAGQLRLRNLGTFRELTTSRGQYVVTQWDVDSGEIERLIFGRPWGNDFLLSSVQNACGDSLVLEWEGSDRLKSIRQSSEGRSLALEYDVAGRLVGGKAQARGGFSQRLFTYEYDEHDRMIRARDAADVAVDYEYDTGSRLVREVGKDGGATTYRYDRDGRCVRYSGVDRYNEKRLRYLTSARTTIVTDSNGKSTAFEYLPSGQVTSQVDALGGQRRFEYDNLGRIVTKISPSGGSTVYEYDEAGNRTAIKNALGMAYQFEYNSAHLPTALIDPNGQAWRREYDAENRLTATTDPTGAVWRFEYDQQGHAVSLTDPRGPKLQQRFVNGQVEAVSDWMGHWTEFRYDPLGNIVERIQPDGSRVTFAYDVRGNLTAVRQPDGSSLSYNYDAAENLTSFSNGRGGIYRFRYGTCSRLLERVNPLGTNFKFVWGTEPGYLERVINEKAEEYTYTRDDLGRSIREVSFDGRVTEFGYDINGYWNRYVNGNGEEISFLVDEIGQIIEKRASTGLVWKYEYDAVGDLIAATSPDATLALERDAAGRIRTERQGDLWVETSYDLVGNVTATRTSLGHEVGYQYDPNRRLTEVLTGDERRIVFERDVLGQERARTFSSHAWMRTVYDSGGRLVDQQVLNGGLEGANRREIVRRSYEYDAGGQLIVLNDARWGRTELTYDSAQRLVLAKRTTGTTEEFEYDTASNCTRRIASGHAASVDLFSYDGGNRVRSKNDTSYEFDGQGRLIRKSEADGANTPRTWKYQWDVLDQLKVVETPDGTEHRFRHDALGRRIGRSDPTGDVRFLWDREVVVQEIGRDGRSRAWITDQSQFAPLAQVADGEVYPIIGDQLGTPREVLTASGQIVWAASLRSWGEVDQALDTGMETDCPARFPGQFVEDALGLHYNFFRYYDPERGAFISQDPAGWEAGPNLYQYARNPINWTDPFGLTCPDYKGKDGKGYVIYHVTDGKKPPKVLYVGITERGRFSERTDEHTDSGRLSGKRQMVIADHADTYGQARGYEQAHIEHYETLDTSGKGLDPKQYPGNRCRSYDPARVDDPKDTRAQTFDMHAQDKTAQFNP